MSFALPGDVPNLATVQGTRGHVKSHFISATKDNVKVILFTISTDDTVL
jgi:hypothetical protein